MKRTELLFNVVSIPTDLVMLVGAGIASFYLRYHVEAVVGPVLYNLSLSQFLLVLYQVLPLQLLIFAGFGLYNLRSTRRFIDELGRVIIGISLGLFLVIILFFFNQTIFPSRFIILAAGILGILFVFVGRLILKAVQRVLLLKGRGLHRLVIINGNHAQSEIITTELRDYTHGYKITAELDYGPEIEQQLEALYQKGFIDEIMQANPGLSDKENLKVVEFARNKGLQFSFVPNLFDVQRNSIEVGSLQGVPVISLKNSPLDGWGRVAKRIFDIIASFICLVITSPLFLVIWITIHADSPGRAMYAAIRVGRGRNFRFYKFRTMFAHLSVGDDFGKEEAERKLQELLENSNDENRNGPLYKIKNDPRVTKLGRFLRKSKLDEIPQFWNVFKGDMSMVGPRPHLPDQVEKYRMRYGRMFSIKPGIFGVTQIAQTAWPTLPFEEEIRLDTYYIENWGLWLDVKILAKSFWLLLFGEKSKENY